MTQILAALLARENWTWWPPRRLDDARLASVRGASSRRRADPKLLTGGLACYRVYPTADGRHLTVAALEQKFFARLCELLSLEELTPRQYDPDAQEKLAETLAETFASKPLSAWLELFDREDVCVGPVATLEEAAADLGSSR